MSCDDSNEGRKLQLQLVHELRIAHLVYHRNKNQHRVARWWKQFALLKRCAERVSVLLDRRNFKFGRGEIRQLYNVLRRFMKLQAPRMYYEFNGVIGLGQFVTLGVVLIGLLAKIYGICKSLFAFFESRFCEQKLFVNRDSETKMDTTLRDPGTELLLAEMANEEVGEVVDIMASELSNRDESVGSKPTTTDVELNSNSEKSNKKTKTKKRRKKKAGSAIDGIFG